MDHESYFEMNEEPVFLKDCAQKVQDFVKIQLDLNTRVVLVTSGGTAVPLEAHTVRFLDNFSAGTRGSVSAEYFIKFGYSVVFLYRQYTLLPYSRSYFHDKYDFLDYFEETDNCNVVVKPKYREKILHHLRLYQNVKYLFYLREIAIIFRPLSKNALFYLAAAVSDFFIPPERISQHKIHSEFNDKRLVIEFDPVPKFLAKLIEKWAPRASIVSFKLETDEDILITNARMSLQRYGHRLVIGIPISLLLLRINQSLL
ncbi:hypothetical protein MERGE_001911 [Pneumocystis wakefieldiae]|uniref:DNA/pantothenate metabolism flavoprotein C-terminal domain-containing protein n=1 Tax=Pneumocystis wakefieldiae TaxID=38082 RepID=A0A899FKR0_9ASCO|nr:hypothetical protein MERGE_001911 [Pneumocystis wakefieldiae]